MSVPEAKSLLKSFVYALPAKALRPLLYLAILAALAWGHGEWAEAKAWRAQSDARIQSNASAVAQLPELTRRLGRVEDQLTDMQKDQLTFFRDFYLSQGMKAKAKAAEDKATRIE